MKRSRRDAGFKQGGRKGNVKKRRVIRAPRKPRTVMNRRTGGFIGVKTKYFDTAGVALTVPESAAWTGCELDPNTASGGAAVAYGAIGVPAVGNGENARIGDEITVKQIDINGYVVLDPDTGTLSSPAKIFLALVLDTQTNGAQLNSEDVYTNPSASGTLPGNPFRDMQYTKRFKVLRTFECVLKPNEVGVLAGPAYYASNDMQSFRWTVPVEIVQQMFDVGSTVASISTNSFHVVGCSSGVTNGEVFLYYNARIRFIDV